MVPTFANIPSIASVHGVMLLRNVPVASAVVDSPVNDVFAAVGVPWIQSL